MSNQDKFQLPITALYEEIIPFNLDQLITLFSSKKDFILLNSAMIMNEYGRYSYLCFDAFATFHSKKKQFFWNNERIDISDPFNFISQKISDYQTESIPNLPPFQGGLAGYFGYEASHYLEELPVISDHIGLPDIYLNMYSHVIAIDHQLNRCWIIATGFPEQSNAIRVNHAKQQISDIKKSILMATSSRHPGCGEGSPNQSTMPQKMISLATIGMTCEDISSNLTEKSYINVVNKTRDYILNGDIFEANLSQQFRAVKPISLDPLALYLKLIRINPAPFTAFINITDKGYIVSASPERFIKITQQAVETCPIKGTRKRAENTQDDLRFAVELASSEKDRAEHMMIVDLMRNDLSKVCQSGSIHVPSLCKLTSFTKVHHLVSTITGTLKDEIHAVDVLRATFPPGSVTGAPKIRAMEIISELEALVRGPYCGCLGYISFTGDMDTSVIIRSYFINHEHIFYSAGGAVVLDSNAKAEYQESLNKARALLEALTS